jgi:hypothetical protein
VSARRGDVPRNNIRLGVVLSGDEEVQEVKTVNKSTAPILTILAILLLASVPALAFDSDGDGVDDSIDNCPGVNSTDLRDSDADGIGNPCDDTPFVVDPLCEEINGNSDQGPLACHIFTLRIPPPIGDTLPPGDILYYVFSVFDTGSTAVLLNPITASVLQIDAQGVPDALDHRIWGPQAIDPVSLGAPLDFPEVEVEAKVPSQGSSASVPNLLGGPVTNDALAYIDYTIDVSRGPYDINDPLLDLDGFLECPAVTFFEPGDSPIPMPLYWLDLEPFGGTDPGPDGGSRGQRYYVRAMRFLHGANTVESPASPTPVTSPSRFLYDTGNTTTQISEPIATALGIDLDPATNPPDDTITIGGELLNCYIIDKVEIDADDDSNQYAINDALVCVKPPPAFGGAADANIGANFFETTQVLFDGPGSRLGLFVGAICNEPPVCDAGGPYVEECDGVTTSVTLDGSGSSDPDGNDLTHTWTNSFGTATGEMPTVQFSGIGSFTVNLTVDDGHGAQDTCEASVTVEDTAPPGIDCNAPGTITPSNAPVSFTATATDVCDGAQSVEVTGFDCFKFTKKGKRIDKTESCVIEMDGDTVTILDTGGVGDNITWTVVATDSSGNTGEFTCAVVIVNPGNG